MIQSDSFMPRSFAESANTGQGRFALSDRDFIATSANPGRMDQEPLRQRVGRRVRQWRMERGWTQDDLAQRCNTTFSTISRIEKAQTDTGLSMMPQLARAFGLPDVTAFVIPDEQVNAQVMSNLRPIPVAAPVQAGLFRPVDEVVTGEEWVPMPYDGVSDYRARRVIGDSMDRFYPEGSLVVTRPLDSVMVQPGDHVVVQRMLGGEAEITLKELVQTPDGVYWLRPHSSNPAHAPVRFDQQAPRDDVEVTILEKVMWALRKVS